MINVSFLLDNFYQHPQNILDKVEKFILSSNATHRYLLGRNQSAKILSEIFDIQAFVDDFVEADTFWQGKPVIKTDLLPENALVVNCSMSIAPISAFNRLKSVKVRNILSYTDFCRCSLGISVPIPGFIEESRKDISDNLGKWQNISDLLHDSESKKTLDDVISYRLTGDYSYMNSYSVRLMEQYFEPFMSNHENGIFIDCGGFDGDTTEEFCKRYPNYKKVYLFEPSITNLTKAKQRLQGFRDIKFMPLGVSNEEGKLYFNPDAGSASCVSDSGSSEIAVTTLDKTINEKVTFIKMDLEGWELKALQGSVKHIQEDHPKLAIAVYHHPSDFWRIPEFVLSIRDDYDLYLRHYTEGWTETIMYFVPHKA